jgi:hypothetical protein
MFKRSDIPREIRLQALRTLGYGSLPIHDLIESFLVREAELDQALAAVVKAAIPSTTILAATQTPGKAAQRRQPRRSVA